MLKIPKNIIENNSLINFEKEELIETKEIEDSKTLPRKEKKYGQAIKNYNNQDNDKIYENFTKIDKPLNKTITNFIMNCLKKHFFFGNLSEQEL